MADSRILHRAAGDSEKVAALSDLEYRVWTQYLLSADDFGVMPASAFVIQGANRNFRQRPTKAIQKALDAVIASGLVSEFNHQGERYIWQPDWNDRQGIRYPRATVWPLPCDTSKASKKTLKLFAEKEKTDRGDSGDVSEMTPTPAGADTRETLPLTPTQAQPRARTQAQVDREERQKYGASLTERRSAHMRHGWCNDRGLCLPDELYAELLGRFGRHREAEFRSWLGRVIDGLGDTVPGEKVWDFWRSRFEAWQGSTAPNTKGMRTLAAGKRLDDALASGAELDPFGTKQLAREREARALTEKAGA